MPGIRVRRVVRVAAVAILWLGILVGGAAQAGRLAGATSPYLLLHADDAIDWHSWGEDALRRAAREEKLIFLSIGYATCYWCHVLSRTTFADPRVIAVLNEHFISILVDREERPDLDHHFTDVMAAMIGRSGWPANFVLTPDLTPLFAAGYIAPDVVGGVRHGEGAGKVIQGLVRLREGGALEHFDLAQDRQHVPRIGCPVDPADSAVVAQTAQHAAREMDVVPTSIALEIGADEDAVVLVGVQYRRLAHRAQVGIAE